MSVYCVVVFVASKLLIMLLLCLCSVLSKEQGITVIAVCLCVEVFVLLNVSFLGGVWLVCLSYQLDVFFLICHGYWNGLVELISESDVQSSP